MGTAEERRKHSREGHASSLEYSLYVLDYKNIKRVESAAHVLDVSSEGMGFYTDYPLEPGHILRFRPEGGTEQTAMVRWVKESGAKYRVGVLLY